MSSDSWKHLKKLKWNDSSILNKNTGTVCASSGNCLWFIKKIIMITSDKIYLFYGISNFLVLDAIFHIIEKRIKVTSDRIFFIGIFKLNCNKIIFIMNLNNCNKIIFSKILFY